MLVLLAVLSHGTVVEWARLVFVEDFFLRERERSERVEGMQSSGSAC